jgi:hypothetical protein
MLWECLGLAKRDEQAQKGRFESDLVHKEPLRFTNLRAWQICLGPLLADQVMAE